MSLLPTTTPIAMIVAAAGHEDGSCEGASLLRIDDDDDK
jgi:hypothetical protein